MKSQLITLWCLITTVFAVFSDEAFNTDWKLRQIGPLDSSNILPKNQILNLLTQENILAGLENGDVRWRVQFNDLVSDAKQSLIEVDDGLITGLNYVNRSIIQLWDNKDGFLIKDVVTFIGKEIQGLYSLNDDSLVVVFINGDVSIVKISNGEFQNLSSISKSDDLKFSKFNNDKFLILFKELDTENTHYAFYNGESLTTNVLQISWSSIRDFHGSKLIYETIKYYSLIFNPTTGEVSKPNPINLKFDKFIPINNDQLITVENNHNIEIINLLNHNKLFEIPNVHKYDLKFLNDVFVLYTEFHINIIDSFSGDEISSYFIGSKLPYEDIQNIITTTDGVTNVYTLFKYQNSSYSYWLNNQKLWERDSSLSQIVCHTIVDFEIETSLSKNELIYEENLNILEAYGFRLNKHFKELKKLYNDLWDSLPLVFQSEFWKNFKTVEQSEYFGFKKLLILGTQNGQIIALNTLNGETVWRFNTGKKDILHVENINNSKLYVFTKSGPKFEINPYTGELISESIIVKPEKIQYLQDDSFFLEIENEFNLILSESNTQSNETKYLVKHDSHKIQGLKIQKQKISTTWKFETNNDEEIIEFSSKDPNEKIANVGIVLGDRSVLYKYLYPNLASFAVLNKSTKTLYIHIIDTITGELMHTTYHDEYIHLDEKVNLVFGEHWVIYSYWSELPYPEQKIVVIDLFESLNSNEKFSPSSSTKQNQILLSSFESKRLPKISTKSFILPFKINSMIYSKTRFGISTKSIILSLQNGQILYLPKFLLNSRRISGRELTTDEKSEGLLPYDPILNIDDNFVISHHRQILGSSNLISIPTNLESTSIICSYGLDVFCTRIYPSSQFDKLTSSFDKVKLVLSIALLIITLLILKPIKESRNLKSLWVIES
ncbi:endoplasmic reticulum membrane protein [Wickerhamomyces ciferrii]|uniref:ER membrane protein complex subunit 1 n=1 Tax=Wickerhamomyces ciferrii (strain ATCC 14091 / BCRC 22168 / CBS 111 / JCM 3599 / NBRC 0793 / NRRL Y-1031 F-60-10) TaxID=1206466 RepID=K0K9U8_WICCF|nr:endoplasmic reticulum membrane protein [Wickerhamomyces ciferrii]CCH41705.1 endoplasmic reticulum membrane protein [Wickerhamomyces ciferrii]